MKIQIPRMDLTMNIEDKRANQRERTRRYREKVKALHPAILAGIERLTINADGSIDEQGRKCRIANALSYQRLYPHKQYTGSGISPEDVGVTPKTVVVTLPGDAGYKPLCEFTEAWCDANNYDY